MKALLQKIRQILKDRKTRRFFTRLVSTVAAIVVFVTTYALVLPAITMESEAACGIEAHQHDQSCYTDVLVCETPESPGHVHDESCYSTKQRVVCQIEEHAHDSDCYNENGDLICEKTEHQHGEDCFEEIQELVCETPESSGHTHTDGCYEKVLTCGKEVHTHSAVCYLVDSASRATTEAAAAASTESAAAADENGLDDSLDESFDNGLPEDAATALTNEVSTDEAGEWASTEAAADATTGTAAATAATDAEEINTEPSLVEPGSNPDPDTEETVDAVDAVNAGDTEAAAADNKQDASQDSEAEEKVPDNAGTEQVNYPSVSFDDSITVTSGALSTDTDAMSGDAGTETGTETEIIVHVEADKDTFPEGTTMVLSAVSEDQMTAVAEAVEGAVEAPKTRGFHAVDISFRDAEGNEIEPLKPIRVSMTSDAIKRAVEDESTAPVVVHVSDPVADMAGTEKDVNKNDGGSQSTDVTGRNTNDGESADAAETDEGANTRSVTEAEASESIAEQSSAISPEIPPATIIETDTGTEEERGDTLTFNAEVFSVYAIVYTVDFHYGINGKLYEFSIPGGGFVSLEHLVEVLGITSADENTENETDNAENSDENRNEFAGEVPGVDEGSENVTAYEETIKLNEVEVSEATKKFVADVKSIAFSNPKLVWAGKVEETATVGGLKEANELEIEYSADLTEEQITKINAQAVEAGDWALISLQSFTSEEVLTVTMNNGEIWTIHVTDWVEGAYGQSINIDIIGDGSITLGEYFHPYDWDWMEYFDHEERNTYYSYRTLNLSVRYGTNTNNQEIVANPGSGYEFDHWELQDGLSSIITTYYSAVIPAGTLAFNPGSNLTAVFRKSTQGGGGHVDFSEITQEWLEKITKDQPVVDKTASVYDYENRIYQIDIGVSSELYAVDQNLDLDFVTDVSGSMLFPSKLEVEASFSNATDIFTQLDNVVRQHHYGQLPNSTPIGELYYLIQEPHGASNVFVVRRYNGQWWTLPDSLTEQIDDPEMGGAWRQLNVADRNGDVVYTNLWYPDPVNGGYYNPDIEKKIYMATDATYRLEYLQQALYLVCNVLYKINPDAKIGITTFADRVYGSRFYSSSERQQLTSDISNITTHGGTRQDLGLEAGKTLLDSETDQSRKKVAILITDGAPNGCTWEQIQEKSDALKRDNIDVYTVGLSLENVEGASDGLWYTSKGYGYAFDAKDGRGLVEAIESIIQAVTVKANMTGSVTDTIDPAFYPVAKDGTPLQPGVEYEDDAGHKYTVSQNGGSWTVNWVDQSFGWSFTDMQGQQPGWKGTVYVKAKENFLGGNAIKTNHGPDSDKVIVTGFKTFTYNEDDEEVVLNSGILKDEDGNPKTRIKTLDSPYVNVDELSFTGTDTQWNVYLGTEVDPKDQLEKLLRNIDIRKVVSGDTNEMITSSSQMLGGTGDLSKTIKLTDYLGLDTPAKITDLVNALLSNGTRTYLYNNSFDSAYSHGYVGDIVITLENTTGCYNKGNHATEAVGQDAGFTLKAEYKPGNTTTRNSELSITNDDYHTTPNGSPGDPTGDMTSTNTHTINVFQKGIKFIKTDMATGQPITSDTAEFTLSGPGKADKTLTTSTTDGSVTENPLEKPNAKTGAGETGYENYTLTETKAPAGYNSLPESLVINLNLTDSFTDPVTGAAVDPASGGLYNWTETARVTMSGTSSSGLVEADEGNSNSLDSLTSLEIFKVHNNPGVELPSTGGPGTNVIYLIGLISVLFSGVGLVISQSQRRLDRDAA